MAFLQKMVQDIKKSIEFHLKQYEIPQQFVHYSASQKVYYSHSNIDVFQSMFCQGRILRVLDFQSISHL